MTVKLLRSAITLFFACVFLCAPAKASKTTINTEPVSPPGDSLKFLPGNAGIFTNTGSPLCVSQSVEYWIYISGCNGPYTINLLINGQYVTYISQVTPFIFTWPPADIWLLSVTTPTCNNITIDPPNHISIQVLPHLVATLASGNIQVCTGGGGTDLAVNFSTTGSHTFTYKINNVIQPSITTNANPYFIHVNPSVSTTYSLNDVTGPICPGTVSPNLVTVTIINPPGASLAGDMTFCNKADTAFLVNFTGTGPYQLIYAIDNVPQPPVTTTDNPYLLPVHTDSATVFTLNSVQNGVCGGSVSGQANIHILSTPADGNLQVHCDPVNNQYTVEFDVVNASLPITFVSGAGTLTGTHFVSTPIHQLQPYEFVFHDSINCKNVIVADSSMCFCVSNADTMAISDTLFACIGNVITAIYNGTPALDGDDSLRFILHTRSDSLGQVLGWNDMPAFGFQPGMHADSVYFISAVVGDYRGNDSIDLADICLNIAPGTPVLFYALPDGIFGNDQTICAGSSAIIPLSLSGYPPWSLQYAVNGVVQSTINPVFNSPLNLILNLADTSVISLTNLSDSHCSNHPSDTANITVNFPPQIGNLVHNCDLFSSTYTVSFEIQLGLAPWTNTGTPGTLSGNLFTSQPIVSGQPYSFSLSDENHCGSIQISDTFICPCATDAGSMAIVPIKLCAGETAQASHNNAQYLDSSDGLQFVLHTPGPGLGTIIATASTPEFAFDPAFMQYGVTYFIAAIAGDTTPGGSVDVTDPCLSISSGTPVIWNEAPIATMSGVFDVCLGQVQPLEIVFTGTAPFTFEYTENGSLQTLLSSSANYSLSATLVQSSTFLPVSVQDANCPGSVSGQAEIMVHTVPEIINPVQFCNPDNLHFSVSFDVQNGDPATIDIVSTLAGTYDPVTEHFASVEGDLPNAYTFYVSDTWQCGQDTLAGTPACLCVTNAGTMGADSLKLCPGEVAIAPFTANTVLDNTDILVFVLHTNAGPGIGTIVATSSSPSFNFVPATMQYGVTYYISAAAGNTLAGGGLDWSDPCLSLTDGMPVVWNSAPTASFSGDFDICPGQAQDLNIVFAGEGPFTFDYTENGIAQTISSPSDTYLLPTALNQSGTFIPVNVQDANCPGTVSGQADITVHTVPEIANPVQVCNPDNLHYTMAFDVLNGDPSSISVGSVLGGTYDLTTGHFISNEANLPEPQTFIVSDDWLCGQPILNWLPDCACVTDAGQISPAPLDICFGSDIQFPEATGQVLDAFDAAQYVLCTDPANLPQSILFQSAMPQFAFSPALQPGSTYYILAIVGNPSTGGTPDFNDPCLSVSQPLPVIIHALPTAAIDGDTILCRGSQFAIPVSLTGFAPFQFHFDLDGLPQNTVTTNLNTFPIPVQDLQMGHTFQLQTIEDQYCTGTASGTFTLGVRDLPAITLNGFDSICPGGIAILNFDLQNAMLCNFDLQATPGGSQHMNITGHGFTFQVSPALTTVYTIINVKVDDNGCNPITSGTGRVDLAPVSVLAVGGDYNGVGISCFGANDGYASATIAGGFNPVNAVWSTGKNDIAIDGLGPGVYDVTVTDLEGCTDVAEIVVTEPEPLSANWIPLDIDCRPGSSGAIQIGSVQNGVGPYQVQINNQPEIPVGTLPQTINGLTAGPQEVIIMDNNGCMVSAMDTIYAPVALSLDLGPDRDLIAGDSILLTGLVTGNPLVSLMWSPLETLLTPDQLSTIAVPKQTTIYSLTIEDAAGCVASDDVTIHFKKTRRIYIPNVIKVGAGQDNDVFTVYGGPEVIQINYMSVYDRWGEHLFAARNFLPNDPAVGWNGMYKGREMPPGVYVYLIEILFADEKTELYKGSVTVVR